LGRTSECLGVLVWRRSTHALLAKTPGHQTPASKTRMLDWNLILEEAALAAVFPGEYTRFVRPIREGLIVFLEGLPESHQAGILSRQASLPATASISQRLAALARDCPVLHKLGQVLARDQRLAPQLREQLRELESLEPTVPDATIREVVSRELGSLERLG